MKLGKYFTLEELVHSDTAEAKGIDNTPPPMAKVYLQQLVTKVLDPLRERWGAPIIVTSGFRCPRLNKLVGGVSNSQHQSGEAADITAKSHSRSDNLRLFELIRQSDLPFDQLIDEKNYKWVHVSYSPRARRQVLHL